MSDTLTARSAFTLVETIVTVAVVAIGLAVSMGGYLFLVKSQRQAEVQDELDIEVQWAIERLKKDIRLSSLDEMFFYPSNQVSHTAISFPLASDTDGDGAVDVDSNGAIDWNRTVVYHVWLTTPNELRVTVFNPRDNSLTDRQRQAQLESVVKTGNGTQAANGENAKTHTVFSNLFTWDIRPRGAVYDAYSPVVEREQHVNLGSSLLSSGKHTFTFSVIGKQTESAGYAIGIDQLFASPCRLPREGEAQLPETARRGATPHILYRPDGSWHGNYELAFPASAIGDYFSIDLANDCWEETNFSDPQQQLDGTVVLFDESGTFKDFVVKLSGNSQAWDARQASGDATGASASIDKFRGTAIRVVLKGEEMINGNWIQDAGAACRVAFRAGNGSGNSLLIRSAHIAELASTIKPTPDVVPGTGHALTFAGATQCDIVHNTETVSDLVVFPIDRTKSYAVSFVIANAVAAGTPWVWAQKVFPSETNTFLLPQTNVYSETSAAEPIWSTNATLLAFPQILAVSALHVTYTTNGTYTSRIIDTQAPQPEWNDLNWDVDKPTGTAFAVKVRTGQQPDLSDALSWSNVVPRTIAGPLMGLPQNRFVQCQVTMTSSTNGERTPTLRDMALGWAGPPRVVDIGGTFTKGPQYGQFELTVDGRRLSTAVLVDLELYRDERGFAAANRQRMTSRSTIEIMPRNTGL